MHNINSYRFVAKAVLITAPLLQGKVQNRQFACSHNHVVEIYIASLSRDCMRNTETGIIRDDNLETRRDANLLVMRDTM